MYRLSGLLLCSLTGFEFRRLKSRCGEPVSRNLKKNNSCLQAVTHFLPSSQLHTSVITLHLAHLQPPFYHTPCAFLPAFLNGVPILGCSLALGSCSICLPALWQKIWLRMDSANSSIDFLIRGAQGRQPRTGSFVSTHPVKGKQRSIQQDNRSL